MMKNLISFILIVILVACDKFPGVNDYAGVPKNSKIAKEKGLLIANYIPNQKKVFVDDEEYAITDCWTSYRFENKNSSKINKENFEFLFELKNIKSGESLANKNPSTYLNRSIQNLEKDYGYSKGIGIESGLFSIDYLKSKISNSPEKITIQFNSNKRKQIVIFKKASH